MRHDRKRQLGIVSLAVEIGNMARPHKTEQIEFLLDSGFVFSVVAAPILERLKIQPYGNQEFAFADGRHVVRQKAAVMVRYGGRVGGADVVFGEPGERQIIGSLALASLGLWFHPLRRELRPLPMILAAWRDAPLHRRVDRVDQCGGAGIEDRKSVV